MTRRLEGGARAPLLFLLLAGFLPGCERRTGIEEHRVTAVVKEYNLALPRAYATRSVTLLDACATPNERERLSTLIEALAQKGRLLDARQEEFRLESIKVFDPPHLADLESVETWWYRHHDPKTNADLQGPGRIRYHLRYKLVQSQGHWLVDRLELLRSEEVPLDR